MGREHQVIYALAGTPVPVPATFGLCRDPAVTGAPFYVMEHVDGVIYDQATVSASLDERAGRPPPTRWSTPWSPSTGRPRPGGPR